MSLTGLILHSHHCATCIVLSLNKFVAACMHLVLVWLESKFPLAPMGVLAPVSAHVGHSAQPPIDTSGNFLARVSAESISPKLSHSLGHSWTQAKFQNRSYTPSRLSLKFTPKYSTVGCEGGVLVFFLKYQIYSLGHSWANAKFQNHSFIPSWLNMKFTPKCSTVGCEGGVLGFF